MCLPEKEGGLGFKDFKMCNWPPLGKQAWRLLTCGDSFIRSIWKAQYFPNSSFMEASLGKCPSYSWRGIWEARWVVKRGMCWRIGDGDAMKVWKDLWLLGTQSIKVVSPIGKGNENLEVIALIDPVSRSWSKMLVSNLFLPFEQKRIISIPLSHRAPVDQIYWDLEKDGHYFVKSTYRAIFHNDYIRISAAS